MSTETNDNQDYDADEKPGVVIDVEPEKTPEQDNVKAPPPAPGKTKKKPNSGTSPWAIIVAVLALAAVLIGGWYSWQEWKSIRADLNVMGTSVSTAMEKQMALQQALTKASSAIAEQRQILKKQTIAADVQAENLAKQQQAFAEQEEKLVHERLQMEGREAELRAIVADIHERIGRSGTEWMVAETEYLIRLAINKLQLGHDVITAQAALELADQRLADTVDPAWTGTREQLARDIAKLAAFDLPDVTGINSRLSALIDQVPSLKVAAANSGVTRPDSETGEPLLDKSKSWDTLGKDLWDGIKSSVRIRKRNEPVQAMLAPEHQYFIYENMKLLLETARLGLLRGDQSVFADSLLKVGSWVDDLFEPQDSVTMSMKGALAQLGSKNINPPMPDISLSLKVFKSREKMENDLPANKAEVVAE